MVCMNSRDVLITYLKKTREDLGMSQSAFSEFLSIPLRTYKGYEYGETSIPFEVLDRIAERINVQVSDMLKGSREVKDVSLKEALVVLYNETGIVLKVPMELERNIHTQFYGKISQLGDKELDLLKRTVDKMLNTPEKKKKAN